MDETHDVSARASPSKPVGFKVSGFSAVISAPDSPAKRYEIKDSLSRSSSSRSKKSGRSTEEATNESMQQLLADGIQALDMDWSLPEHSENTVISQERNKDGTSRTTKAARSALDAMGLTASSLGKRPRGGLKPFKKQLDGAEKEQGKSIRILEHDEID